jgi:hypothetical protein
MLWEHYLQALKIIFGVHRKRSTEKITRKKKVSNLQKHVFFHFSFFLDPILLSNLIILDFFIHFK